MRRKKYPRVAAEITGLAFGGRGIGRLDGLAVFVPNTVPGDRAVIQITRQKKNFAEAYLAELLESSPDRVSAPCRYSGVCGGCAWQFLRYEKQLEYKRRHVAESLEHIGGIVNAPVHATVPPILIRSSKVVAPMTHLLSSLSIRRRCHGLLQLITEG